jgi:hypothetical protein
MKLRNNRKIPEIERKFYTRQPYTLKNLKEILLFKKYDKLYRSRKTQKAYQQNGSKIKNYFNGKLQLRRNLYPYNFIGIQHWFLIYYPTQENEHQGWNLFTEKYLKAVSDLKPEANWINPPNFRSQKHIPHAHFVFDNKWQPPLEYQQMWK